MRVSDVVGGCASLAALLEVSAYPKPGNVHRLSDFKGTRYEHFLASSAALGSGIRLMAEKGRAISGGSRNWGELGVGEEILSAIDDMLRWQGGGNVHLGIILLFSPLAAAAGAVMRGGLVEADELREALGSVIKGGTPLDSVNIYRAIDKAMSAENLGKVGELDVKDGSSLEVIMEEGLTPVRVFSECKNRDSICSEWVTGFEITFNEGYPLLKERLESGATVNGATLDTFINILANRPDSLIRRKRGAEEAVKVSERAKQIVNEGGATTQSGMRLIELLDDELRKGDGSLNPGTTADLTASSLFVLLLTGWRP